MNPTNSKRICVLACLTLVVMGALCKAAPVEQADQDDFTDEPNNEFDEGPSSARSGLQREPSELSGYNGLADFNALQGEQYPVAPAASSPTLGADHPLGENNMSTEDESDADEGESSELESSTSDQAMPGVAAASLSGALGHGAEREAADSMGQQEAELRQWSQDDNARGAGEQADADGDSDAQDSNIANAKIELTPHDMATAAGHHHHHGHGVHGWLEMGAKTGKKGAFKWHDKHPVGGKGRR